MDSSDRVTAVCNFLNYFDTICHRWYYHQPITLTGYFGNGVSCIQPAYLDSVSEPNLCAKTFRPTNLSSTAYRLIRQVEIHQNFTVRIDVYWNPAGYRIVAIGEAPRASSIEYDWNWSATKHEEWLTSNRCRTDIHAV